MDETNEFPQEAPPAPGAPAGIDLKRRMRELLSIPDSQRSEQQWDELIEIEIQLAPGNRVGAGAPQQGAPRGQQGQRTGNPGGGANNWKRHGGPGRKNKPGGKKPPPQGGPAAG